MQEGASGQDGEEQMGFCNEAGEKSLVNFAEIIWSHLAEDVGSMLGFTWWQLSQPGGPPLEEGALNPPQDGSALSLLSRFPR